MSWSDRSWLFRALAALLVAGLLTACGFEPVYKPRGQLQERLDTVYVEPVDTRIGQATRNALLDAIGAQDRPATAAYRLKMKISSSRERSGIQADETASRVNVKLNASWVLTRNDEDATFVGAADMTRSVPFNVVDDDYASLIAERDAEKLAGRLMGEAIRTRVLLLLREG